jgi:alkanesulfonate monooxygenase SsuD/methylene tetrahydromethanopterin reductase-like flavin-dependent oxidoreductase (luciferase family)
MSLFGLRFDLRNPAFAGTTMSERYRAAIEMSEWADALGFVVIVVSEHHGSDDGYLPSPLTMAAAIAARTERARIQIAALIAPFHDPIRLAEDIAVVDQISGGRLDVIVANGYVPAEFEMFGVALSDRVNRTTETVATLRQAWTGEPFVFRGHGAHVTPTPHQPGGPKITLGGSTEPAARRAARIADGFMPSNPDIWDAYRDEMAKTGKPDPGPSPAGDTSAFYLARDVEAGWAEYAPYALHEMNSYGSWMAEAGLGAAGGYVPVADADALRATGQYRVLTPEDFLEEMRAKGPFGFAMFHPLVGGVPPDMAWKSLRLFEEEVLPHLDQSAGG